MERRRKNEPVLKLPEDPAAPALLGEDLVSLKELPELLPKRRRGRAVHFSTVWRWMTQGCHGIVLESLLVGGVRFTSREALNRFLSQINKQPITRPARRRQAELAAAEKRLAREGL